MKVVKRGSEVVTTSLIIADVFGKSHNEVLCDIVKLENNPKTSGGFTCISVGNEISHYYLNVDAFSLLVGNYVAPYKSKVDFFNEFTKEQQHFDNMTYEERAKNFKLTLLGVEHAARILNLSDEQIIKSLKVAHDQYGVEMVDIPSR